MDGLVTITRHRRILPFLAGVLGALVAWAAIGIFGSVFGFAAGFLLGALLLSLGHVRQALGHGPREARMHREAMAQLRAMGALGPMRLASPPARRTSAELRRAIAEMETLATTDMSAAVDAGRGLRAAFPKSAAVLSRLAVFERAAGHDDAARGTASEAIDAALGIGATSVALDLYDDFAQELEKVEMRASTLLALAGALSKRGRPDLVRRCVERLHTLDDLDARERRALTLLERTLGDAAT